MFGSSRRRKKWSETHRWEKPSASASRVSSRTASYVKPNCGSMKKPASIRFSRSESLLYSKAPSLRASRAFRASGNGGAPSANSVSWNLRREKLAPCSA